jgi:hypothetical protein
MRIGIAGDRHAKPIMIPAILSEATPEKGNCDRNCHCVAELASCREESNRVQRHSVLTPLKHHD